MQTIRIKYDPYKMETTMSINDTDIRNIPSYANLRKLFATHTPLQTWIEPIKYKNWNGLINELVSENRAVKVVKDGKRFSDNHVGYIVCPAEKLHTDRQQQNTGYICYDRGYQHRRSELGLAQIQFPDHRKHNTDRVRGKK